MALLTEKIKNYETVRGIQYSELNISYQIFGKELLTAPIVVVFHALTGNSDVCSDENGWWKQLISYDKCIDLNKCTVICFNILGNGYDGTLIDNYKDFVAKDIAILAYKVLKNNGINNIFAVIGGSLGGGIAWELVAKYPDFSKYLIAVATDWKSTDWMIGICGTQESILLNSKTPIADARKMAMLFYRTPQSLTRKFNREKQNEKLFKINSWLNHHGKKLENRFALKAYLMMNHLLKTIDIAYQNDQETIFKNIKSTIIQIGFTHDILFPVYENVITKSILDKANVTNHFYELDSDDGHDAFLIEHTQITEILNSHFKFKEEVVY